MDKAFGLHIAANLPTGFISLTEGPSMAGACNWQVVVKGKGGHGSMPYASIDPIKPLAEILLRVTSLMVNRMDTLEPIVVSPATSMPALRTTSFPKPLRCAVPSGTSRKRLWTVPWSW